MSQNTRATVASCPCQGSSWNVLGSGRGEDVGFLDTAEAVDSGSVEGHPLGQRVLELGWRDVEALWRAKDVGEPELHEADPPLLHGAQHVVSLTLHQSSFAGSTGSLRNPRVEGVVARFATQGDPTARRAPNGPVVLARRHSVLWHARGSWTRPHGPIPAARGAARRGLDSVARSSPANRLDQQAGHDVGVHVGVGPTIFEPAFLVLGDGPGNPDGRARSEVP